MALPTVERNWVFVRNGGAASTLNQSISPQADSNKQQFYFLWLFKDTLVNFFPGPWTVVQSKIPDGTYGNADYWTSASTLWSSNQEFWIVLENTFAGRTAQILIWMSYPNVNGTGYIYLSTGTLFPASVAGAVPVVPSDALRWNSNYSVTSVTKSRLVNYNMAVGTYKLNVIQTWDAIQGVESLRFSIYSSGNRYGWGFWDKVKEVSTGGGVVWDYPEIAFWGPYDDQTSIFAEPVWSIFGSDNRFTHIIHGALPGTITKVGAFFTTEMIDYENKPIPFVNAGIPSDLTGTYSISELGITSNIYPMIGKIANLVDFWIGSNVIAEASYYPSTAQNFYQIGNFVWPWDGITTPETT